MTKERIYHAVAKRREGDMPLRTVFTAANPGKAIVALIDMMKVSSSADIYEFEILEVLGHNEYKVAARKLPATIKPRVTLDTKKLDEEVVQQEESFYNAYSVEAA